MDFIKLHRQLLSWEWYHNINTCRLFIHMLLKANWKDGKFEGNVIKRGSFISSIGKLAKETDLTEGEIRTAIKHLKLTGEITSKNTNRYTVFTIVSYDLYQDINKQIDSQSTSNQQAINNPLTTIEEYKEIKNNKKEVSKDTKKKFEPPSLESVIEYCQERGSRVDAYAFFNFYESKGWMVGKNKMRDWKAAVRTWERSERDRKQTTTNQFNNYQGSTSPDTIKEFEELFMIEGGMSNG